MAERTTADRDAADAPEEGSGGLVRSEERMHAGTVNVVVGRARLVTYVVTEEQTLTVPVRRQEVRLVYDAVPEDEQVMTDAAPAEETYEVVLHSEQVLVSTQVVPVERVRLVRRVHTTDRTITDQVRSEHVEIERDAPGGLGTGHQPPPSRKFDPVERPGTTRSKEIR